MSVFALMFARSTGAQSRAALDPEMRGALRNHEAIRKTGGVLEYELVPSFNGTFKRASFRTNRWGMRDKEYALKPAVGTFRIALLGSSFTMGGGVPMDSTVEWLVEDRLNREATTASRRRYEILNFSVGGYGALNQVAVAERKVFQFAPNAVLLVIHTIEAGRLTSHLISLLREGRPIEYPYLRQKLTEAGVRPGMEEPELRRKIGPIAQDLVKWSYRRIADLCRERRVSVFAVAFPLPRQGRRNDERLGDMARLAVDAGIPVVDLRGVYEGYPENTIALPRDAHLNALGHRIVADRLYQLLRENELFSSKTTFAK